jgi:hypothetical protein
MSVPNPPSLAVPKRLPQVGSLRYPFFCFSLSPLFLGPLDSSSGRRWLGEAFDRRSGSIRRKPTQQGGATKASAGAGDGS